MAEFILQGKKYELEEMSFEAVERAWPYITVAMTELDPIAGVNAGIAVVAAAVIEQPWFEPKAFDFEVPTDLFTNPDDYKFAEVKRIIKRKLKSSEIGAIRLCVIEMTKEAGLMPEEGELPAPPLTTQSPGTETSTESSPSSLQPALKVDAGSE